MAVETLAELLVETALTFAPALEEIPVLGRILSIFAPGGGNDLKALEALNAAAAKTKQDRATRIAKNARYVLKASEAMKCVENTLGSGQFLLSLGKALINQVAGRTSGVSAPDLLMGMIFDCIEAHTLSQKSKRVKETVSYYARPSRGHGKGRKKIKVA
jgi:hypothetical protein